MVKIPKLIGEVGINHSGNIDIAKRLIDACFACGWDYVKFQKRNPDKSTPEHQKCILKDTPWGKIPYIEYKRKIEFGQKEYDLIDFYCKMKPIKWTASVWDIDSLDFILQYDVPFIKIPSAHLTNYELLVEASSCGKTVVLSTGMSTLEEIDKAVSIVSNAPDFILMHTNSSYPTPIKEINLEVINTLRNRYNCKIAYSGHEFGLEPTLIAATMNIEMIERHITIDHNMWGTDQAASVEINGMDMLKKRIQGAILSIGNGYKTITPSEVKVKEKLRG